MDKDKLEQLTREVIEPKQTKRPYFEGYAPNFYFQTDANTDDWYHSEPTYRVGQMG